MFFVSRRIRETIQTDFRLVVGLRAASPNGLKRRRGSSAFALQQELQPILPRGFSNALVLSVIRIRETFILVYPILFINRTAGREHSIDLDPNLELRHFGNFVREGHPSLDRSVQAGFRELVRGNAKVRPPGQRQRGQRYRERKSDQGFLGKTSREMKIANVSG